MSIIQCLHPIEENEEEIVEVIIGLYLGGMWFGVATRTDIKNMSLKDIGLHAQNMITFVISIVNIIFFLGGGGEGLYGHLMSMRIFY